MFHEQLKSGLQVHWDLLSHLDSLLPGRLHFRMEKRSRKQPLRALELFILVLRLRLAWGRGPDE